ncbi:MAG: hypothetical protein RLZZ301_1295 [Bacteroidota bacterium]
MAIQGNDKHGYYVVVWKKFYNKTQALGCSYQIYDLNGRQIAFGLINSSGLETTITLPDLKSAVYILRITKNNEVLNNFKLMKY